MLWDMEHGIKIGEIPEAFTVMDQIKLVDIRPRAQFSPVDRINITMRMSEILAQNVTHCIQVIDKAGRELVNEAR